MTRTHGPEVGKVPYLSFAYWARQDGVVGIKLYNVLSVGVHNIPILLENHCLPFLLNDLKTGGYCVILR